jgi:SAM-dependent methyltransferase
VAELPIPPLELRELVGPTDPAAFDNPGGAPIWDGLPDEAWRSYLDFGCGCGRSARRLLQQHPRPGRYVGIDLHGGMVRWCRDNLVADGFEFLHHDVYNPGFNPDPHRPWVLPFPVADRSVSIVEAWSVFTHLLEAQAEHYLDEVARVLTDDGLLICTFFLFDKAGFPFMQDSQNALYINETDPTNAVVFDRGWLLSALADRDLELARADAPFARGYHTVLRIGRSGQGRPPVELPVDDAPYGRHAPPLVRAGASRIGLDDAVPAAAEVHVRAPMPPTSLLLPELDAARARVAELEAEVAGLRVRVRRLRRRLRRQRRAAEESAGPARRLARRLAQRLPGRGHS